MKFILALCITLALMLVINQRPLPGEEENVNEVTHVWLYRDPLSGDIVVAYKMGESEHNIRDRSISAIVFTRQRQTIYFGGGKLSSDTTKKQFDAAVQKFLLEDGK